MQSSIVGSRRLWSVVVGGALVAAAGFQVASAKDFVPFKGDGTVPPAVVTGGPLGVDVAYATISYSGTATHIGQFTTVMNVVIYPDYSNSGAQGAFVGYEATYDATTTAADGDVIYTAGDGGFSRDGSGWNALNVGITGGTGRFEGATGSIAIVGRGARNEPIVGEVDLLGSISSVGFDNQ